ncbi:MAG: 5-oxoprolinase subunit PxpB [Bacteroidota bacterium]
MFEVVSYGDRAYLVNFQQEIDPTVHRQVLALQLALEQHIQQHITFLIPAYTSLTVGFSTKMAGQHIKDFLQTFVLDSAPLISSTSVTHWKIPVCYDASFAMDQEEVVRATGLDWHEVIHAHTEHSYRVYMLGFRPGFGYLGTLPDQICIPRKQVPRQHVPIGSVGLAGSQTGIYPVEAPGGWQIIGRCPLSPLQPEKRAPSLLSVGDRVRFEAVDLETFIFWQRTYVEGKWKRAMWHDES